MRSALPEDAPLRLLIVDDQNDDAELVVRYLRRHDVAFDWVWAPGREEMVVALKGAIPFDVVLTDHHMPGFTSFEVLRTLRTMAQPPPCVIVSGAIGEETAVEAMQAGAADYVAKENLARLVPVIRRSVEEAKAAHARAEAERRLRESERHLRRLVNTAEEGICETDDEGRVTFANARMAELLGYEPEEMVGIVAREWIAPRSISDLDVLREKSLGGERQRVEMTLRKKDGTELTAIVSLHATYAPDGRFRGMLAMITDISARKEMEQELQRQALHDPVTGLPNRVLFMDRLAHALASAERDDGPVALFFLDLDDFKHVNDTFGHEQGDQLLRGIAARLSSILRPQDTVSRLAGDEFTLLCPGVGSDEAEAVGARIRVALSEPFIVGGQELRVAASIGAAVSAGLTKSAAALLHEADTAMYRAKEEGRDRVEFFDLALRESVARRVQIENGLQSALRDETLSLVYQPIVSLGTGRVTQFEALLRWQHPELGSVSPSEFIPIAEENGIIRELGHWVARTAFRALAEMAEAGVGISINLSARQLMDPELAGYLAHEAAHAGVRPDSIHLEVTETMLVGERTVVLDTVAALKAYGFNLVLDDFGTGYSALSYLKRLPFDLIKIDRSFIDGLGGDGGDDAIVTAIVGVAEALGLSVVAEGVETLEQADWLTAAGADYAQGYHFARPLPMPDATSGSLSSGAVRSSERP
jgi:diguanylate cyclase (GGDEF)-like protein/PAS domain S-box-containing protein